MKNIKKLIIIISSLTTGSALTFNVRTGGKLIPSATPAQSKAKQAQPTIGAQHQTSAKGAVGIGHSAPTQAATNTESSVLTNLKNAYDITFAHGYNPDPNTFKPWTTAVTTAITFIQSNTDGDKNLPIIAQALDRTSAALTQALGAPSANVNTAVKKVIATLAQVKPSTARQTSAAKVAKQLAEYLRIASA